jgi:hypothetical protein
VHRRYSDRVNRSRWHPSGERGPSISQLARRRFVEIVAQRVVVDGGLSVVGREEVDGGLTFRDGAVERGRFNDKMDDAEERRICRFVRPDGFVPEMIRETASALRLAGTTVEADVPPATPVPGGVGTVMRGAEPVG